MTVGDSDTKTVDFKFTAPAVTLSTIECDRGFPSGRHSLRVSGEKDGSNDGSAWQRHACNTRQDAHAAHEHVHEELGFLRKYVFSTDHKTIGIQYTVTGLLFLFFGFCLMMMMRWQLAYPGQPIPLIGALARR